MTKEEAIAYFTKCNEDIISVCKDENVYNYEKQEIEAVYLRRTFEANCMAISALKGFEGMTYGEVLQAIISGLEPIVLSNETGAIYLDWEWWNAPYKAESEDKE